jgi:hypothetical protein
MTDVRGVERILSSRPTIEGAGVNLKRAFGPAEVPMLDPFLMLDDFHSEDPRDYMAGFPWHPHRGIETVTYMIRGVVEHGDTIGNRGAINSGDVQWMTAGSGILHQEMPREYQGLMQGFQLWVNLPASNKMMGPRYRGIVANDIPTAKPEDGVSVKIVAGRIGKTVGPVRDLVVDAQYLDVSIKPRKEFVHPIPSKLRAFGYIFEGSASFSDEKKNPVDSEHLVVFGDGNEVRVKAGAQDARLLLVSGEPIKEPVAWGGPIVMNTNEQLRLAFDELSRGTFIKAP